MTTLYVTEPQSIIRKDGETLVVSIPAQEGRNGRKVQVPLIKVDQVVILGDSTLTAPAMAALLDQRTEITFLNSYGQFRGRVTPAAGRNCLLRLAQFRAHVDPEVSIALAQKFVTGKLHNLRTILMRSNRKLKDPKVGAAAEAMRAILSQVDALQPSTELPADPRKPQAGSLLGTLHGLEGAGSARYFEVFGRLLRSDTGLSFDKRSRRPPRDPVNALLSYGYTLLLNQCSAAAQLVGFDPYIGYLHSSQYSKPALALDLMEEFRGPIVDSVVMTLINNRMLTSMDFIEDLGSYRLKDGPRKTFLVKFEERLNTEIEHPTFAYKATYRRCIELQARLLAKTLTGEIAAYPPLKAR